MNQDQTILNPLLGWILLVVFGVAWVMLGKYWGRKADSLDGFMLAGRNVGMALGAATAMATWVTSNTIILAPQFALKMGIWGMLAYSTASFGLFLFAPMAGRIRELMPQGYTSGDFIRLRYGKTAWRLFLVISLVYSMAWLVSMGMAGGVVLEALAGIHYVYGMSLILLVCVLYTLVGGLYAVIGTDFIQSLIILIGVLCIGVVALINMDLETAHRSVAERQPTLLSVAMPVALLSLFNNMFFGIGEVFHNNVWWSRAFAIRKKVVSKAFLLAGLFWLPIPIAAGFVALFSNSLGINITDIDMAGPLVAGKLLGSTGAIVLFIVVFCSLGSSIDSLLAATSDLLTEDVYRKMINPRASDKRIRKMATYIIIGLGVVTWIICYGRLANLIVVLFLSGPLVSSAIWPVLGGLYWKKPNRLGATLAMSFGSIIGLICYWEIGWFSASLASALVSMCVMLMSNILSEGSYDFSRLADN